MTGQMMDFETSIRLAMALRTGDDTTARLLFASTGAGIPDQFLVHPALGPRGDVDIDDAAAVLHCVSALANGKAPDNPGHLTRSQVIDLVAEAAEVTRAWLSQLRAPSARAGTSRARAGPAANTRCCRAKDLEGTPYLRALGGIAALSRDVRREAAALFTQGPVVPGSDEEFPRRLLSRFGQQADQEFQTAEGDEYRFCETIIRTDSAGKVWRLLAKRCLAPPEPPIRDVAGYHTYLASLPSRFWTRLSSDEIELAGKIQAGRLTNLGTIKRGPSGFKLTANSVQRVTGLETEVLKAAADAGCAATVTTRSARTADELTGGKHEDESPGSREAMCRRLGIDIERAEPRKLIMEQYFLPLDSPADGLLKELNRDLAIESIMDGRDGSGRTHAEAVAAGGEARMRVLAMIDDCEWRLTRKRHEGADTSYMADPDELRRRLGLLGLGL